MDKLQREKKLRALLPYFLFALAVIAAYRISGELGFFANAVSRALGIIAPFFYGFLFFYIVNIPRSAIQSLLAKLRLKFIVKRQIALSILITFVFLTALITLVLNLVIPTIVSSIAFFIANIPAYQESVMRAIDYFNTRNIFGWQISADALLVMLGDFLSELRIVEVLSRPVNIIVGAGTTIFTGIIAFIAAIYILLEKEKFKAFIQRLITLIASHEVCSVVLDHFGRLNRNFRQYIRTQTIDGIILGTLATILLLILGSPYALVLGIMLGIVNYIPYFGSIFGTLIAVVVVAFTQGITMGLISAGALFAVQQIDANVIQPKLMSGSFSLSPLLVIISITIGGAIAGIFGMIAAIPIVAVLKDILESVMAHYERKKFGNLNLPDNN
jgi:predicted PurR-regulated permease PerM